jgi:hypothetical protein
MLRSSKWELEKVVLILMINSSRSYNKDTRGRKMFCNFPLRSERAMCSALFLVSPFAPYTHEYLAFYLSLTDIP